MFAPPDFLPLLQRAQLGDKEALQRLLDTLRPLLEQLARGYADPECAEASTADLVQESWLRAWQNLGQFEPSSVEGEALIQFRAWITQLVHRLGLNAKRNRNAKKRRPDNHEMFPLDGPAQGSSAGQLDPAASQTSPSEHVARDEEAERVRAALEALAEPRQREVLTLRFFKELSLKEIALRLGLTYDTARGLFAAAMEAFEAQLERPPDRSAAP